MSKENNKLICKNIQAKYHQLKKEDRIKIETLASQYNYNGKRLFSNIYIANVIGVHKSTIGRELKNRIKSKTMVMTGHTRNLPYSADSAQKDYLFKRALSKAEYKLEKYPEMAKFIIEKMRKEKWAPDAIVGFMKNHGYFDKKGFCSITTQAIYYDIRMNVAGLNIKYSRRMKEDPIYEYQEKKELSESKQEYSINKRPEEVDKRLVFGHFELDTVIGKKAGKHQCLLTLTERKTRFEMIFKLEGKTASAVVEKFEQIKEFMKNNFDKVFKSITTDNGTEFSNFLNIIKNTKTKIYFCHPYCSGEKGTNEKHNSIIRYFIPKGELMEKYSCKKINEIVDWMNNYPRKILNYKTPTEMLLEEFNNKGTINKIYKLQEKINNI
ncbi:MAG: IS30 family transposase [Bacilli bacterium]